MTRFMTNKVMVLPNPRKQYVVFCFLDNPFPKTKWTKIGWWSAKLTCDLLDLASVS